jgi:predicted secreted protein
MSKRLALVWVLLILTALAASAGDVAQFVNLGFSPDGKSFMFGQYGITEKGSLPWAGACIVEVAKNAFVPKGNTQLTGSQAVDPGASGLGALLKALSSSAAQVKRYKIDHLVSGRLLYILMDGAPAADALEFRDFQSGKSYRVALAQSLSPKGESSSFSITVSITDKDGKTGSFVAGDPTFKRPGVKAYHIKQIILSPDGGSLVFVVQKEEQDTNGNNIRYMVETARQK